VENKSFSIKAIFCDINHILSMPLSIKGVVKLEDMADIGKTYDFRGRL